ncbi:hypothetical protein, partial [Neomoorella mulderi]
VVKKIIFWLFLAGLMLFPAAGHPAASPGGSSHPQASWETLADSSKVYGFWQDSGGYRFLIECDPATGQMTGFAYLNSGKYVEQEVQVLDGYDQIQYIDTDQPKRYLYPPIIIPATMYRGRSLPIRNMGQDPYPVGYPYGDTITEDWRPVIIPLLNKNDWPVTLRVHAFLSGDDWTGDVTIGPYDTKWVMLKLPANARAGGYNPYETAYIFVHAQVVENYDPYAPERYKHNPPADDGDVVAMYADIQGLEFSGPQWVETENIKVFDLEPAFKEVLRWVPDDPNNWRIGHPEYDVVPGYRWVDKTVGYPIGVVDGEVSSELATQEDIDQLKAVGDGPGYPYYKFEGVTLKRTSTEVLDKWRKPGGYWYYVYRYHYKARIPIRNYSNYWVTIKDLSIACSGSKNPEVIGRISGTIPPGETRDFYCEFYRDTHYKNWRGEWVLNKDFSPRVKAGSIWNGIGGLLYPQILDAEVTLSAVAGGSYCNNKYQSEYEPSIPLNMFKFERVMTPAELARYANYNTSIRENITYFLAGHPELMRVTGRCNYRSQIFDD